MAIVDDLLTEMLDKVSTKLHRSAKSTPRLEVYRSTMTATLAHAKFKPEENLGIITLGQDFENLTKEARKETLVHELAHIAHDIHKLSRKAHGYYWKWIMAEMGYNNAKSCAQANEFAIPPTHQYKKRNSTSVLNCFCGTKISLGLKAKRNIVSSIRTYNCASCKRKIQFMRLENNRISFYVL